nr:hypothetical protein [Tanacetum cinerariifolium]
MLVIKIFSKRKKEIQRSLGGGPGGPRYIKGPQAYNGATRGKTSGLVTHDLEGHEFEDGGDVVQLVDFDLLRDCMMVVKEIVNRLLEEVERSRDGGLSFENRPPMLNKENYVPWSSRLLWYAKSRPNGNLIHKSIINGPYVRWMIPEPGDPNCEVPVNETFHVQTDDELTEKELKQIEADDQAIQTILIDLPEDIYAAVDSCETAQEIWL